MMTLIQTKEQLIKNIKTLEDYLTQGDLAENQKAISLVKNGICFVAYPIGNYFHFAPSRFVGYINNNIKEHSVSSEIDGRETNKKINKIFYTDRPIPNEILEKHYSNYCNFLGITRTTKKGSFGIQRKFWQLESL